MALPMSTALPVVLPTSEPAPEPTSELASEPIDVVVLVAPDRCGSCDPLFGAIEEVKQRDHAAVLVVFTHPVDAEILDRAATAGADLCVVTPVPTELFGHIERTRARFRATAEPASRHPPVDRPADRPGREDPLDALWRRIHSSRRG